MIHAPVPPVAAPADGGRGSDGRGASGQGGAPDGQREGAKAAPGKSGAAGAGAGADGAAKAGAAKDDAAKGGGAKEGAAKAGAAQGVGAKDGAATGERSRQPAAKPPGGTGARGGAGKGAGAKAGAGKGPAKADAPAKGGAGARPGGDRGQQDPTAQKPSPARPKLPPPVPPARPRRRHGLVTALFLVIVVLPLAVSAWYLYTRAADQYASTVGFSVRREEAPSASDLLGNLPTMSGASSSDTDVLNEFMQSQEIVERIDARLDLRTIFTRPQDDPVFALAPGATIEDLVRYWNRMVAIYYDGQVGLIELRVLAFDPEDAQAIAQAVFDESSAMINELTAIARQDATRYARDELEDAMERLKAARTALTAFRSRTRIVDPAADIQGQMGLLSTLQTQLAEALIELDLLRETTRANDPRITQAEQRIAVIENRIEQERAKLGMGGGAGGTEAYATLVGEYESLIVDREFAEQAYLTALTNYDAAQAEAQRQSRYLAAHIQPTLAQSADYPRRAVILGAMALFAFVAWATLALVYYSIRDRR